ncbi:hypothetical protein, partial [Lactiplantibacillus paraxiangfangensis]|uniref:hypothetical protein n=1 Tax=Lactiplantibacillus paraxiangfangensis TaxID=3076224 RepID=UPI0030C7376A
TINISTNNIWVFNLKSIFDKMILGHLFSLAFTFTLVGTGGAFGGCPFILHKNWVLMEIHQHPIF